MGVEFNMHVSQQQHSVNVNIWDWGGRVGCGGRCLGPRVWWALGAAQLSSPTLIPEGSRAPIPTPDSDLIVLFDNFHLDYKISINKCVERR